MPHIAKYRIIKDDDGVITVVNDGPFIFETGNMLVEMLNQRLWLDIRIARKLGEITPEQEKERLTTEEYKIDLL